MPLTASLPLPIINDTELIQLCLPGLHFGSGAHVTLLKMCLLLFQKFLAEFQFSVHSLTFLGCFHIHPLKVEGMSVLSENSVLIFYPSVMWKCEVSSAHRELTFQ